MGACATSLVGILAPDFVQERLLISARLTVSQGFISVVGNVGASSKARPQTALTERSSDSINSVRGRKASVSSQNSMSSVRSNMSMRSERSTSSFASSVSGVARERSGFLLDGSLRDQERRAHRATALEVYVRV